jgi:hypothetical protein
VQHRLLTPFSHLRRIAVQRQPPATAAAESERALEVAELPTFEKVLAGCARELFENVAWRHELEVDRN